jgi:hypothetical protein
MSMAHYPSKPPSRHFFSARVQATGTRSPTSAKRNPEGLLLARKNETGFVLGIGAARESEKTTVPGAQTPAGQALLPRRPAGKGSQQNGTFVESGRRSWAGLLRAYRQS